eukprot:SAG31_NODE_3453_length_4253_cov_2.708233_2_plen_45_part_00
MQTKLKYAEVFKRKGEWNRVGQVRSYFLVFVPIIREIRDFYRDM